MKTSALAIRFGIQIGTLLILYFLAVSLIGIQTNPLYSLGNGIIMAIGLYSMLKQHKKEQGENFEYQNSFMTSLFTGGNATLIFVFFFATYVTYINPQFLPEMLTHWSSHYHVGNGAVIGVAAIMGFSTTLVLTLSFMQLFKPSWNLKKNDYTPSAHP